MQIFKQLLFLFLLEAILLPFTNAIASHDPPSSTSEDVPTVEDYELMTSTIMFDELLSSTVLVIESTSQETTSTTSTSFSSSAVSSAIEVTTTSSSMAVVVVVTTTSTESSSFENDNVTPSLELSSIVIEPTPTPEELTSTPVIESPSPSVILVITEELTSTPVIEVTPTPSSEELTSTPVIESPSPVILITTEELTSTPIIEVTPTPSSEVFEELTSTPVIESPSPSVILVVVTEELTSTPVIEVTPTPSSEVFEELTSTPVIESPSPSVILVVTEELTSTPVIESASPSVILIITEELTSTPVIEVTPTPSSEVFEELTSTPVIESPSPVILIITEELTSTPVAEITPSPSPEVVSITLEINEEVEVTSTPVMEITSSPSPDELLVTPTPTPSPEELTSTPLEEVTPSPSPDEILVTPTPSPSPDELSSTPLEEVTPSPSPDEILVTPTPSPSPDEILVTPTPTPSPEELSSTPLEEITPSPSPDEILVTPTPSPSPDEILVTPTPTPSPQELSSTPLEEITPSPSPDEILVTPTPSPDEILVTPTPSPSPDEILVTPTPSPSPELSSTLEMEVTPTPELSSSMDISLVVSPSPSPSLSTSLSPSPTPSVPAVVTLEFLEPLEGDTSPIRTVMPGDNEPEILEEPISIEDNQFTQLHVGDSNGIISLQNQFLFDTPSLFPTDVNGIRVSNVFAPFWASINLGGSESRVRYQSNSLASSIRGSNAQQNRINKINEFIRNSQNESFNGTFAFLVDWNAVHPAGFEDFVRNPLAFSRATANFLNSTNTFQAIIVHNSSTTYVIYTYKCGMLTWTGPATGAQAVIGYNLQDGLTPRNEPLSGTEFVNNIACSNLPSSEFVNIVYKFTANLDLPRQRCLAAKENDIQTLPYSFIFLRFFVFSPDCPCSIFQAIFDFRYTSISDFDSLQQGVICFTRFFSFTPSIRCCYSIRFVDGSFGSLSTSGQYASSVLSANPIFQRTSFLQNDLSFFQQCCLDGDFCDEYYDRRPRENAQCFTYRPPRRSWFFGDPHIRTLDERSYTFNGLGEYIMADVNNTLFTLQARTGLAAVNSTATIFTAFVAADFNGTRVQVEIGSDPNMMVIRLNGVDVTMSLNGSLNSASISIVRTSNTTISTTFPSTVSVEFSLTSGTLVATVAVPEMFQGDVVGLLGNFDGDSTNDFIFRNNLTSASDDISDSEKHVVAQSWQITQEESLFFYNEGENVSTFSDPNHIPTFLDKLDNVTRAAAIAVCGETNTECIFDFSQTGNQELAMSTLNTNNENIMEEEITLNFPPTISGPDTFRININESSMYMFNVSDPGDTINITVNFAGSTVTPDFQLIEEEEDGFYTLSVVLPVVEPAVTVTITATDSRNASASVVPQVELCGCINGGNCTKEGIVELSANPLTLLCICPEAYTGRFCQTDLDGCLIDACFANANCTDVPAPMTGITCPPCPSGFNGSGIVCLDVDECGLNTDNCQQLCSNTQGSFECGCMPGFMLSSDGITCENIDECATNQHDCQQICNDLEGSFNCSCQLGFNLNNDQRTCTIDPNRVCPMNNSCDQLCALEITEGSGSGSAVTTEIQCFCLSGFTLVNGTNCDDFDECSSNSTNPCQQNCTNGIGNFSCSCLDGFNQDGFMCNDINECSNPSACQDQLQTCINTEGSFICECQEGFTLNATTMLCDDVDECITTSPCAQNCTNTIGLFTCSCNAGFILDQDKMNCLDVNECDSMPCQANQMCNNTVGSFMCLCLSGFIMTEDGMCVAVPEPSVSMSSPSITMTPTPTITMTPTQSPPTSGEREQTVDVTLAGLSENDFDDEARLRFRVTVAEALNIYCNETDNDCDLVSVDRQQQRKRQSTSMMVVYEANDVVIVDTSQRGSSLVVTFFVRGTQATVLLPEAIVIALREQPELFTGANFTIEAVVVTGTTVQDDDLSAGEIAGIVIAVIVVSILFILLVVLVIWFCWRKQGSKGRYAFVEKSKYDLKQDFTIENAYYEPHPPPGTAPAATPRSPSGDSVHSMTLKFDDAPSSSDDESSESGNEKAKLDDSEETRL